jgi:DNA-binding NtrC family response regulator
MTGGRRVLVVDDNENILSILRDFLEGTYAVETAPNAVAALSSIAANPPDIVLLDVNMPGTDGLTLLASLRQRGVHTPVFIMTGYDSPSVVRKAVENGATQYLVKPVDLRKLDRLIAGALHTAPILAG